jgi:hypothetical protein
MYGKLIDGVLKHSKSYLIWNGRKYWNAPAAMWIAAGWKHIVYDTYPDDAESVRIEYTEDDENIYVHYVVEVEQNDGE